MPNHKYLVPYTGHKNRLLARRIAQPLDSDNDVSLTLCPPPWEIFHTFLSSADFFQNQLFRKILSEIIPSKFQTVWIQIRPEKCRA